ncbi:MAG: SPOR domain-containing protein [Bacteroidales bacterium]|nr:SPOR domain-containing protein [Bacteroidales bacterium]
MKKNHYFSIRLFIFTMLLSLFTNQLISQESDKKFFDDWSINLNAGANLFYGDIEVYNYYPVTTNNNEWRMAYGLILQKELGSVIAFRGQVLNGKISGTKRKIDRYFEADILETSISATINISSLLFRKNLNRTTSIYALVGIGITQWKSELKDLRTDEIIRTNGVSGGSGINGRTVEGVVPFGLGLNFKLNQRWHINLEGTLRPVQSDLLDATEGDFQYDFYSYNSIGVIYNFGKKKPSIPVEYPVEEELIAEEQPVSEQTEEELILEELILEQLEEETVVDTEAEKAAEELRRLEEEIIDAESKTKIYEKPWHGVEFRVQIMATRTKHDTKDVSSKFSLTEPVKENFGDNWYRYSVGAYSKYWKAKEYRNILISRHNVYDAFVVAYMNEERLSLAQVLKGDIPSEIKEPPLPAKTTEGVLFRVQILAAKNNNIPVNDMKDKYNITEEIQIEKLDQWYQYTTGNFDTYEGAKSYRNKLIEQGINDAFIVAYRNGVRISLSNAIKSGIIPK